MVNKLVKGITLKLYNKIMMLKNTIDFILKSKSGLFGIIF